MSISVIVNIVYVVAAICFIWGIKKLGHPKTARRGNLISALGMFLAVLVTLLDKQILSYQWIALGIVLGTVVGLVAAQRVAMTAMPELVALFNGFGGLASLLVGWAAYVNGAALDHVTVVSIFLAVLIGAVTFTGSMVAWAKLSGKIGGRPMSFPGQHWFNALLVLVLVSIGGVLAGHSTPQMTLFYILLVLSLLLGKTMVLPIGGADMPVVISLLNSYSGLAACAAGFALRNNLLIVAGSLVGASGVILTVVMCKAMNRSLSNVLFSGFGSTAPSRLTEGAQGEAKSVSAEDAYYVLEAAKQVVIVPGYGLAVAQAQHVLAELVQLLENNGVEVRFAIHPVAGRMPGHMNVLLAEANVPYEQLVDMDDINPMMETMDVCLVIGANDVVNESAKEDAGSPIYGMPIIEAGKAKVVYVLKRSMASGFAGIENPLFFRDNAAMIFGDAKQTLQALVSELKE